MITPEQVARMTPRMRNLYAFYVRETRGRFDFAYDVDRAILSFEVPDGAGMCDFCPSTIGPYTVWDADDVVLLTGEQTGDGIPHESVGAWLACVDCTPLVAGADREALLARAFRSLPLHEQRIPEVRTAVRLGHAAFWRAKR